MHKILNFLLILIAIYSCNNVQNSKRDIEDFVPENASIILSINSLDGLKSAINNNDLLVKTAAFKTLNKALIPLDSLQSKSPLLVCINNQGSFNEITFITHQRNLNAQDSLLIPHILLDSILVASNSKATLETLKTQSSSSYSNVSKLHQNSNTFSVYFKAFPVLGVF